MPNVEKLIGGFRVFKATTYQQKKDTINHLLDQGYKPSTLVITCSDLRIAPENIFATNPGELYLISNLGGLIPPFNSNGIHGILSAIEYAVKEIGVENIIILGHAKCDAVKMMMSDKITKAKSDISESMKTWLSIAKEASEAVKTQLVDKSKDEQLSSCEHEAIVVSLYNLMEYPYVAKLMEENKLKIFGWHFDVESGSITSLNPQTGFFEEIL